ncbi:MAG: Fic family protein, partial [Bdellovibrionales bacterium]|nr:Fic family protein [Bdellovibrionales bacterium]
NFCPIIRRTKIIQNAIDENLSSQTQTIIGKVSNQLIARAASFLLLADTQASFAIEGETPPRNRIERWGKAISEAGKNDLSIQEIVRLHRILIEDDRFTSIGLRKEEVFLGERDPQNNPMPEFIGAKHTDLEKLMDDFFLFDKKLQDSNVDPVLHATAVAFGFVYIHPLADGNGRLHRYLLHHVLAQRGFAPKGIIFPISSEMHERVEEYSQKLKNHSGPLMDYIEWEPNEKHNVEVRNDTYDLYRFLDCTEVAEFIFSCVKQTIVKTLPREIEFLQRHDSTLQRIMNTIEMPDQLARQFILFARQNDGKLGKKRRKNEFADLTDEEVKDLEEIFKDEFEGFTL